MKTILLTGLYLLMSFSSSVSSSAQSTSYARLSPEELAQSQTEIMASFLSLSGRQIEKVQELNLSYTRQMFTTEDSIAFERKETGLKSVLTKKQFEIWQVNRAYLRSVALEIIKTIHPIAEEVEL